MHTDILIIGGGLAGLTAALHLQREGLDVVLVEKNTYPHHKVCGEYISNEVLPYLEWLDADPMQLRPAVISRLMVSSRSGKSISTHLPLGGFGISRYTLDHFLYQKFVSRGGKVISDTATTVEQENEYFITTLSSGERIISRQVIGAYGKRSAIDIRLKRAFIRKHSPFLAVKAHYQGEFEQDLVALHNFKGGYCGVSRVEDQKINICYLADYHSFMKYKNPVLYQENVLYQNKALKNIFENSSPLFEKPVTVSQLSFGPKKAVVNHILMIGDTAGLIHPLCGNGMAMAIHSAKCASELLVQFFQGKIKTRAELEDRYARQWRHHFSSRLQTGNILSALLKREQLAGFMMETMIRIPAILPLIIRRTHGQPLTIAHQ